MNAVAWHEAAHLCVAVELGMSVESVWVGPNGTGATNIGPAPAGTAAGVAARRPEAVAWGQAKMTLTLAGRHGEALADGAVRAFSLPIDAWIPYAPGDTPSDEVHAWQLACEMAGDAVAPDLVERCDRRAASLVARLEAPIRFVAAELVEHGEFVGTDVTGLVERARKETGWTT